MVAAHPDDEVLGCGGLMARFRKEGHAVFTLILGEGIVSRKPGDGKNRLEIEALKKAALRANRILGVKKVFFRSFPDNKFDTAPMLDIVRAVEEIKKEIKPEIIFTHFARDLNIDHRCAYQAVITAARPLSGEGVREIYSFEVLSSTEWAYPLSFSPDVFFEISRTVDIKLKALKEYKNELRRPHHPRSVEAVKLNARLWGIKTGLEYAEAFKNVRSIRKIGFKKR